MGGWSFLEIVKFSLYSISRCETTTLKEYSAAIKNGALGVRSTKKGAAGLIHLPPPDFLSSFTFEPTTDNTQLGESIISSRSAKTHDGVYYTALPKPFPSF